MESTADPVLQDNALTTQVESFGGARANPEEFRASLAAVHAAQESARARARRETYRARMIAIAVMAALGIVAWSISLRRSHNAQEAIVVSAVTPAAAAATPVPPAQPAKAAPAAVVVPAGTRDVGAGTDDGAACDSAFAGHQWQSVIATCAAAFKARPSEGALAMRVAHALHRRGYFAAAGVWAGNAIAVDPNIAEAFVVLARAEAKAGQPQEAAAAYRRYLTLAPRGWHSAEARRVLDLSDGRRASAE